MSSVHNAALAGLLQLRSDLNAAMVEREEEVTAAITALVAGENLLFLGPPGTGKSMLINLLSKSLGTTHFERLMTKYTTPEEVFGPLKLSGLKEDRYERNVDGYLPTAQTAFLDEVFKANSAILNALLSLLNERVYDNGTSRIDCPLVMCLGASNELPENGEGLEALFDRFVVRRTVSYVTDDGFRSLMSGSSHKVCAVSLREIELAREAAAQVTVPDDVITAILELRKKLSVQGVAVSDRRWRKSLGLIRASAALAGRSEATNEDLEILKDVLWTNPDDIRKVGATVLESVAPSLADATKILDAAVELYDKVANRGNSSVHEWIVAASEATASFKTMIAELDRLGKHPRMVAMKKRVQAMLNNVGASVAMQLSAGSLAGES